MKTQNLFHIIILLSMTAGLTACPLKNSPRQVHEGARKWQPTQTPTDENISASAFATVNTDKMYAAMNSPDASNQTMPTLKALSKFVLNSQFIENPQFRTLRLQTMINVFDRAFLIALNRNESSAEFQKIKQQYYDTVMAGCTADLRMGCNNLNLFRDDAYFARIMTKLAKEYDTNIEAALKGTATPEDAIEQNEQLRTMLDSRYRRLGAATGKRNAYEDSEYSFAYLKFARAFAALIAYYKKNGVPTGYIADVHAKIFESIIFHYEPKKVSEAEFRTFVENFKPWTYSHKTSNMFEHGTRKMFEFGSQCCLYADKSKTSLSDSVKTAIMDTQNKDDIMGKSFHQLVVDMHKQFGQSFFDNLGLGKDLNKLLDLNSSFYNEYFLVIDRLFRGHLDYSDIEMVMKNTPDERTREQLPKMIALYVRVYLADMIIRTNVYMAGVYASNPGSDRVFKEAIDRSRELTSRWHTIQSQSDQLERFMSGYFKGRNIFSTEVDDTTRMIKSINRNIHYISVYPNMIAMNFFLAKMKGNIVIPTWWGEPIKINADTVLDYFFDGNVAAVWFPFAKDEEPLDRQMLLYSFQYMIETGTLSTLKEDRAKFFDLIFSKYVDDNISSMRVAMGELDRTTYGSSLYSTMKAVCDYETGKSRFAPNLKINLYDMIRFTYSGLGDNGVNTVLSKLLNSPFGLIQAQRGKIESRATFIRAMIDIIEHDLIKNGKIQAKGQPHVDTASAYAQLRVLEEYRRQVTEDFINNHGELFECALRLQEIERRRANRLYEEERAHLGKIFDIMKPLASIKDQAELDAEVKKINAKNFNHSTSEYRFDEINGLTYRMSKYDLLMRMKKRIESDIFQTPSEAEARIYGKPGTGSPNSPDSYYWRPRPMTVDLPEALNRDDMIARQTANTIFLNGDGEEARQAFIDQGMANLRGQNGSFVEWFEQWKRDSTLFEHIYTLEEFYLQGPIKGSHGQTLEVTAQELLTAYTRIMASAGMDKLDVKTAIQFGSEGRLDQAFWRDRLFEGNGAPLAFFYPLMNHVIKRGGVKLDEADQTESASAEALKFARNEINLRKEATSPDYRAGAFVFNPTQDVADSIRERYGNRAHKAFQRVNDLFEEMLNMEKLNPDLKTIDARLSLPLWISQKVEVQWYSPSATIVDRQKRKDQLIMIDDFVRRTGNFYGTKELVKVKWEN